MTPEECHLWFDFLVNSPIPFRRQKVIGKYIIDFYCPSKKLAIELDGSQHYEEENRKADIIRDEFLSNLGITVLRYTNIEIHNNFRGVCEDIELHLK